MRGKKTSIKKIGPSWIDQDECLLRARLGEDADEVLIGDPAQKSIFIPQVSLTRWNKEDSLSILFEGYPDIAPVITDTKIDGRSGDQGFYFDISNPDALKFGLVLYAKPKVNSWIFKLQGWENLEFIYQRPLTNWNPDDSTWEIIPIGMATRLPGVGGGYAVYHKQKANHILGQTNYKTGQFGLILCPKFIDAVGNYTWATLEIDKGDYRVSVSNEFLDKAIYPIRANDEFGYHTQGGSYFEFDDTWYPGANVFAAARSPSTGGTIILFSEYGRTNSGTETSTIAAYSMNGALPVSRLAAALTLTFNTTAQWINSTAATQVMANGTTYCIGYGNTSGLENCRIYYNDGSAGDFSVHNALGALPATWVQSTTYAYRFSNYATYTPGISLVARQKTSSFGHLIVR